MRYVYLHVSALYSEIYDSYNNYEINSEKRLDQDRSQKFKGERTRIGQ